MDAWSDQDIVDYVNKRCASDFHRAYPTAAENEKVAAEKKAAEEVADKQRQAAEKQRQAAEEFAEEQRQAAEEKARAAREKEEKTRLAKEQRQTVSFENP